MTKRLNLSVSKMKVKPFDFCIRFSPKTTEQQFDYIIALLDKHKVRHLLIQDKKIAKESYMFVAIDDPETILREAGNQTIYKPFYENTGLPDHNKMQPKRGGDLLSRLRELARKERAGTDKKGHHPYKQVEELERYKQFTFERRHYFLSPEELAKLMRNQEAHSPLLANDSGDEGQEFMTKSQTSQTNGRMHAATELGASIKRTDSLTGKVSVQGDHSPIQSSSFFREANNSERDVTPPNESLGKKIGILKHALQKYQLPEDSPSEMSQSVTPPLFARTNTTNFEKCSTVHENEDLSAYLSIFSSAELLRIKYGVLSRIQIDRSDDKFKELFETRGKMTACPTNNFIEILTGLKIIKFVSALHDDKQLEKVTMDEESMLNYFGEEVTMYFLYLKHYRYWLKFPAIGGIIIYFLRSSAYIEEQIEAPIEALYALAVVIWATLYVICWKRRSNTLATKWHSYSVFKKRTDFRPEFKGYTRINLITDLPELYYPKRKRFFHYLMSVLYSLPLLALACALVIVFLNVSRSTYPTTIIHIDFLARMGEDGGIFAKGTIGRFIPLLLKVAGVAMLNSLYRKVSERSTLAENHMLKSDFEYSLVLKRFVFMFISNFLSLFYIAFWRFNLELLRIRLVAIYTIDEIRRVGKESIIPYLLKRRQLKPKTKADKTPQEELKLAEYVQNKIVEVHCPQFQSFVEYIEMVFQFGYVCLFAAVFPLAAPLSVLFNYIEMNSDFFKIKTSYRRPIPQKSGGIGPWFRILQVMSILSVTTNTVILTLGQDSVLNYITGLARKEERGEGNLSVLECETNIRNSVILFFFTEHALMLTVVIMWTTISLLPTWVDVYRKRRAARAKTF